MRWEIGSRSRAVEGRKEINKRPSPLEETEISRRHSKVTRCQITPVKTPLPPEAGQPSPTGRAECLPNPYCRQPASEVQGPPDAIMGVCSTDAMPALDVRRGAAIRPLGSERSILVHPVSKGWKRAALCSRKSTRRLGRLSRMDQPPRAAPASAAPGSRAPRGRVQSADKNTQPVKYGGIARDCIRGAAPKRVALARVVGLTRPSKRQILISMIWLCVGLDLVAATVAMQPLIDMGTKGHSIRPHELEMLAIAATQFAAFSAVVAFGVSIATLVGARKWSVPVTVGFVAAVVGILLVAG